MKKLVYSIVSVSIFSLLIISCNKDNVSIDKNSALSSAKTEDSPIAFAEKELGKLEKKDFTYIDEKTGSTFVLRIAARTTNEIQAYLDENEVTFFGITEQTRLELLKNAKNNTASKVVATSNDNPSNLIGDVITELVSKKLGVGITGFGQTISPKNSKQTSNKNARPSDIQDSYSWKQPSIPWCEQFTLQPISSYPTSGSPVFFQTRGWWWNGSGSPFTSMLTNGVPQTFNCDGPKFTRVGTLDDFYNNYSVTWLDLESGESETK